MKKNLLNHYCFFRLVAVFLALVFSSCTTKTYNDEMIDKTNAASRYPNGYQQQYYQPPQYQPYGQQQYQQVPQGYGYQQQGQMPYGQRVQSGSRFYSNPYDVPPAPQYYGRYDTDQYYVPPTYYNNVENSSSQKY